ncbi:MAG TPA: lipase family protein [Microthrixaceae bacterium]|nr:lipase family protein [Microthrixaceae bacterium]
MTGARQVRRALAVAISLALAMTAACTDDDGGDVSTDPEPGPTSTTAPAPALTFYEPATVLDSGAPGDVLETEPLELDPNLPGTGQRITFVSSTPAGDLVPVTGVLIAPSTPKPAGGYPVVVWAHGTTGVGDACAPSSAIPFTIPGGQEFLAAGYAIAAPDYEGLGQPDEIHPYLVGLAEGHNVLDAARAASTIGGGSVAVTWGWSQGGHAALFAASIADEYAPELDVRGAAVHAPVTDAALFLLQGTTDPEVFPFTAEAILAWSEVYEQTNLTDLVVVEDAERARLAQQACTGDIINALDRPLDEIFLEDPANTETWRAAAETNSVDARQVEVPVIVAHGDADPLVPEEGSESLVAALCAQEVPTTFLHDATWDHNGAYLYAYPQFVEWITARIEGDPAPSECT